jgi:rRNA pseudouridine-1189 N-methylase Emg1 (Nep1/Mra1 family)
MPPKKMKKYYKKRGRGRFDPVHDKLDYIQNGIGSVMTKVPIVGNKFNSAI